MRSRRTQHGFPLGVVDQLPVGDILKWTRLEPTVRASVLARLVVLGLADDACLASILIGEFGDDPEIASDFFSAYVSGAWTGPSSAHWKSRAESLEVVSQ